MKLLYYNEEFLSKDGSRRHADNLCNALRRTKKLESLITYPEQLKIDTDNHTKQTIAKGGFIISLARFFKRFITSITTTIKLCTTKNKFDIVLARLATFDWTPLFIKLFLNRKYILEWNTPFYYECGIIRKYRNIWLIKFWEKIMLKYAYKIYTISEECANMLSTHYNLNISKFIIIPNGFELTPIISGLTDEHKSIFKEKLHLENKFIITFIGSLKIWHGIQMIQELSDYYTNDQRILFIVIGDGEARNSLHPSQNLKILGALPYEQMQEYLVASDLGIMPYPQIKNFYFSPLKMYDMVGAALPFIAPPIGQIKEFLKECPDCGFSCKSFKKEEYINLINQIIEKQSSLQSKRKSLLNLRLNYSWDKRANSLIDSIITAQL